MPSKKAFDKQFRHAYKPHPLRGTATSLSEAGRETGAFFDIVYIMEGMRGRRVWLCCASGMIWTLWRILTLPGFVVWVLVSAGTWAILVWWCKVMLAKRPSLGILCLGCLNELESLILAQDERWRQA